jgi:hypothetical protein
VKEAIIAMATRGQLQAYVEPYKDWVMVDKIAPLDRWRNWLSQSEPSLNMAHQRFVFGIGRLVCNG